MVGQSRNSGRALKEHFPGVLEMYRPEIEILYQGHCKIILRLQEDYNADKTIGGGGLERKDPVKI